MIVLSLFDGISCGQVGFERAGIKIDKYFASEIDKYAIQVTQKNYPDTIQIGDVRNLDFKDYKDIGIVIGGSPCTFWSIAKKNREVDKTGIGWQLFSQFVKAIKTCRPKYFLYENVESMPSSIKDFISEEFRCEPIMINSSLVSAQERKRLYWTNIPGIAQPEDKHIYLKDIIEDGVVDRNKSYCLDANYYKIGNGSLRNYFEDHKRQLVFDGLLEVGKAKDINGHDFLKRVYSIYGKAPTLTAVCGGNQERKIAVDDLHYRKLTPVECERLQTLPDNYTEGISNSQRYKCLGNGWTVDVVSWIFSHMKGV